MKSFIRSLWLSLGIGLLAALLTFLFITYIAGHPIQYAPAKYNAVMHISFVTGHQPPQEAALQGSLSVIRKRMKAAHTDYDICGGDNDVYTLSLTGITDTAGIGPLITTNSRLGFYEVYTLSEIAAPLALMMQKRPSLFTPARAFIENGTNEFPAYIGYVKRLDTALLQAMLQNGSLARSFPSDIRFAYRKVDRSNLEVYAIRHRDSAFLSSESILEASSRISNYNGEPQIVITFAPSAAGNWQRLTEANTGRPLAICFSDRVASAPVVSGGIANGRAVISGNMSKTEAQLLGILIQWPQLPLPVKIGQQHFTSEAPVHYIPYLVIFFVSTLLSLCIFLVISQWNHKKNLCGLAVPA